MCVASDKSSETCNLKPRRLTAAQRSWHNQQYDPKVGSLQNILIPVNSLVIKWKWDLTEQLCGDFMLKPCCRWHFEDFQAIWEMRSWVSVLGDGDHSSWGWGVNWCESCDALWYSVMCFVFSATTQKPVSGCLLRTSGRTISTEVRIRKVSRMDGRKESMAVADHTSSSEWY